DAHSGVACPGKAFDKLLRGLCAAVIADNDQRTEFGEPDHRRTPDTTASTRHQRHLRHRKLSLRDAHFRPSQYGLRNSCFRILPTFERGSSALISTAASRCVFPSLAFTHASNSDVSIFAPSFCTTSPSGVSPH